MLVRRIWEDTFGHQHNDSLEGYLLGKYKEILTMHGPLREAITREEILALHVAIFVWGLPQCSSQL